MSINSFNALAAKKPFLRKQHSFSPREDQDHVYRSPRPLSGTYTRHNKECQAPLVRSKEQILQDDRIEAEIMIFFKSYSEKIKRVVPALVEAQLSEMRFDRIKMDSDQEDDFSRRMRLTKEIQDRMIKDCLTKAKSEFPEGPVDAVFDSFLYEDRLQLGV